MDPIASILNDSEETNRRMLEGFQMDMWTAIPGYLTAINFDEMTCTVQPTIQGVIVDPNGKPSLVNLPLLLDVPIVFPKGGGFLITMPLAVNDEVLVVFSSRCIDSWWHYGGIQGAWEARINDLSDGFAIPGPFSLPKAAEVIAPSTTDLQIRNLAGTSYVSIGADGKIKLVSASEVDITAPVVTITGAVTVAGTLACGALTCASIGTTDGGSATIAGSLSATEVTAGGIPLSTHHHTGITVGGGTSGPPVP